MKKEEEEIAYMFSQKFQFVFTTISVRSVRFFPSSSSSSSSSFSSSSSSCSSSSFTDVILTKQMILSRETYWNSWPTICDFISTNNSRYDRENEKLPSRSVGGVCDSHLNVDWSPASCDARAEGLWLTSLRFRSANTWGWGLAVNVCGNLRV